MTLASRNTAVRNDRPPSSRGAQRGGDDSSSAKCHACHMTFASRSTAVRNDRPPSSRGAQREGDDSSSPKCHASHMTFASRSAAVRNDRPPRHGARSGKATVPGRRNMADRETPSPFAKRRSQTFPFFRGIGALPSPHCDIPTFTASYPDRCDGEI